MIHGSKSMAAITQFAEANAGITPQKKSYQTIVHARVPTMSIGLMCTTSATNGMVLLDSCSQEHIIKDKELMENMSDCQSEIYLSGIVDSSNVVKSMGCGTALGLEAYYVPGASSNLISYAKLLSTGHMIETAIMMVELSTSIIRVIWKFLFYVLQQRII